MTRSRPLRLEQQHPKDATESSSPAPTGWSGEVNGQLVSVVIPCYNQAHFLGEAIESVLKQTYPHYEIVVVDDGSTDNTSELASHYERVHLIRQDNQGLSAARNTGIRHSEGEYLVFLDADDRLLPEALKAGLECFSAHPESALVAGYSKLIKADGSFHTTLNHQPSDEDPYVALLEKCHIAPPASGMYQRSVFEAVGGFKSGVDASADYEMYLRIARRFQVRRYDEAVAEYRMHGENMIRNSGLMLSSALTVLRSQRRFVKGDKRREAAYKSGIKYEQEHWGDPLVEQVRAQVQEGEWGRAVRGMRVLLRYYPQGLAMLVNGRRRLAWQLKHRNKQLRNRERQLQELRVTLQEERRKLGQARKQNQALVARERKLQRQLQEIQESETWRLLQKVNRVRARAFKK
jgi:glycosyltransferase involved in cell wall biosynthesis